MARLITSNNKNKIDKDFFESSKKTKKSTAKVVKQKDVKNYVSKHAKMNTYDLEELRKTKTSKIVKKSTGISKPIFKPLNAVQIEKEHADKLHTQTDWDNLVSEKAEDDEYLQPFQPSKINRFWEHGLNPITGMSPVSMNVKRYDKSSED